MRKDILPVTLGALVAMGVLWCLIHFASAEIGARRAWIEACVEDGNKRYQCEERWELAHPPRPSVTVHR